MFSTHFQALTRISSYKWDEFDSCLREACEGWALAQCEAPRPRFYSCPGGGA
ncbi:MAG: hypothetical protein NZ455_09750 [Bacteroidia bacterium]|nr:hypothetical protein [Bacteroidia bacterium]MDW8347552.1 hypothetical protein [Bacteroidia bacterium]